MVIGEGGVGAAVPEMLETKPWDPKARRSGALAMKVGHVGGCLGGVLVIDGCLTVVRRRHIIPRGTRMECYTAEISPAAQAAVAFRVSEKPASCWVKIVLLFA